MVTVYAVDSTDALDALVCSASIDRQASTPAVGLDKVHIPQEARAQSVLNAFNASLRASYSDIRPERPKCAQCISISSSSSIIISSSSS